MWAVMLTFRDDSPDEETLIAWAEDLDASVSALPGLGFMVIMHVDGADMLKAAATAVNDATAVVSVLPSGLEVLDEDLYDSRATAPTVPELVSAVEAAELLGVSRQRIHQLHNEHKEFPEPLYRLRTGPLWTREAIEWFAGHWDRAPGRPARTA